MFVLVELRDTVTIAPSQFHRKMHDAVTYTLNKKFANKVVITNYILIIDYLHIEAYTAFSV